MASPCRRDRACAAASFACFDSEYASAMSAGSSSSHGYRAGSTGRGFSGRPEALMLEAYTSFATPARAAASITRNVPSVFAV